jgi:hypothetical protein
VAERIDDPAQPPATLRPDGDSWRERDEHHFVAFAVRAQDAVAAFLARSSMLAPVACFEDPQAEQTQHDDEGEVVRVR